MNERSSLILHHHSSCLHMIVSPLVAIAFDGICSLALFWSYCWEAICIYVVLIPSIRGGSGSSLCKSYYFRSTSSRLCNFSVSESLDAPNTIESSTDAYIYIYV